MEKDINYLSEQFKLNFELFINGCDSNEVIKKWDKEENGEMDVYFTNDILCVITYLAASDGQFQDEETEFLNDIFGTAYTTAEYEEVYKNCYDCMDDIALHRIPEGVEILKTINPEMAKCYKELLVLACEIISFSDRFMTNGEDDIIRRISELTL